MKLLNRYFLLDRLVAEHRGPVHHSRKKEDLIDIVTVVKDGTYLVKHGDIAQKLGLFQNLVGLGTNEVGAVGAIPVFSLRQELHIPVFSNEAQTWIQNLSKNEKQAIALFIAVMNLFDRSDVSWVRELIEEMALDTEKAENLKLFVLHDTIPHFLDVTIAYNTLIHDDGFLQAAEKLGFHFLPEYRISPKHDIAEHVSIQIVEELIELFQEKRLAVPPEIFVQIHEAKDKGIAFLNAGKTNPLVARGLSSRLIKGEISFALELHRLSLHHRQELHNGEEYAQHAMLERIIDVISGMRQKRFYKKSFSAEEIMGNMRETANDNLRTDGLGKPSSWIQNDANILNLIELVLNKFLKLEENVINIPLMKIEDPFHVSPLMRMTQENTHLFFFDVVASFHVIYKHLFDDDSILI